MSEKFKLIVAGTRSFNDYELLRSVIAQLFMKRHCWIIDWNEEIVSGGAPGADTLAVRYATEADIPFKVFPADWKKYGRSADGGIRGRCNSVLGRQEPGDAEHDTANARAG